MIIVPVKEGENIERALKKFKRKFEKTGVVKELRSRQQFNKPSVLKRLKMDVARVMFLSAVANGIEISTSLTLIVAALLFIIVLYSMK